MQREKDRHRERETKKQRDRDRDYVGEGEREKMAEKIHRETIEKRGTKWKTEREGDS
jgi:hypothetical protein